MRFIRSRQLVVLLGLSLLAACGATGAGTAAQTSSALEEATDSPRAAAFPVTVENCGITTTFTDPPERVVAVSQPTFETLLALGLADRIVGYADAEGDGQTLLRADLADEAKRVPILTTMDYSKEIVLSAKPDFMVASYAFKFNEAQGLGREQLAEEGIQTHLFSYCSEMPPTFEDVYAEILTLGRIFGVQDRAEEVVEGMRRELETVTQKIQEASEPPRVFIYDTGEDAPLTRAGQSITNLVVEAAGGNNVFGDSPGDAPTLTWEAVVATDPEFILVMDYGPTSGYSGESQIEFLRGFPPMQQVPAVRENRIMTISAHTTLMGVRATEATATVAKMLYPELFQ